MQQVPESSLTNDNTDNITPANWTSVFNLTSATAMNTNDATQTTTQSSKGAAFEDSYDDVSTIMRNPWDPLHCADWDAQPPSATCLARLKR
jgi:hypothetical protein